ncbi:MAG: hypothetical protein P4L36_16870 [Holophaga sp.]|nr:hypothetical protein [Holophaga sp.]
MEILSAELGGPPALVKLLVPKLVLDDGTVIWGCEAWWAEEEEVQALAQGRQVEPASIEELRRQATEAWEKANKALDKAEESLP